MSICEKQINLIVAADDEGIEAVRAAFDGAVGRDGDLPQRVDQQAGRYRQAGPQGVVRILEGRLHPNGAARLIDRVVDDGEMALRNRLQPVRTQRSHGHGARGERYIDLRHVLLRRREHDGDRLQLHNRHDARRVSRMHDVAGINEAKARLPREWRSDCRIAHLRLGVVDRRLIAFDLRGEFIDRSLLRVELLPRDGILLGEPSVAHKIELSVLEARLVLRLLRNRLIERRLIRAWIDLDENIAFLDHLAQFEVDLDDLAIDSAAHKNGLVRLDDAEPVQIDW